MFYVISTTVIDIDAEKQKKAHKAGESWEYYDKNPKFASNIHGFCKSKPKNIGHKLSEGNKRAADAPSKSVYFQRTVFVNINWNDARINTRSESR